MKRRIRQGFMWLLAVAMVSMLTGCGSPVREAVRDEVKIGVALYDQYDTFISELYGFLSEYARVREQETGVKITLLRENADGSQEAQNSQVQDFIKAGCDVLCVNLVDRMNAFMIIDQAEAAQIPVIFFNRELVEADLQRNDQLYYVGADASQSGRLQGEIVAALCGYDESTGETDPSALARYDRNGDGVIQYVMLEGEADHQDAALRTESSTKALMDAGFRLERLDSEIANWVRSQAETKMQEWLRVHENAIELVLANNDDMALGAIDALKRASIPSADWPLIVGIDGTSVGLKAVLTGEMTATVHNDAQGQAEGLLLLAFALATGTEKPALTDGRYIRLPYRTVTPENVVTYLQ